MATKVIDLNKWVPLKKITIKITDCDKNGIHCRIFGTVKLDKIEHEYDMFPQNLDFFTSLNGTLNIMESEGMKMKVRVEII